MPFVVTGHFTAALVIILTVAFCAAWALALWLVWSKRLEPVLGRRWLEPVAYRHPVQVGVRVAYRPKTAAQMFDSIEWPWPDPNVGRGAFHVERERHPFDWRVDDPQVAEDLERGTPPGRGRSQAGGILPVPMVNVQPI